MFANAAADINKIMDEANISNVAMGHYSPETGFSSTGFGKEHARERMYGAASLSKPVFSYLVLKLIQDKKIDLKTILNNRLSFADFCTSYQLPYNKNDEKKVNAMTVEMALSHMTGLASGMSDFKFNPGDGFCYSNLGLLYLQKVIEKLTGSSLQELAKKYVFDPLGMKKSMFYQAYDIAPAPADLNNLESQKIYLSKNEEGLEYQVIGLDGMPKKANILWDNLPADFPRKIEDILKNKEQYLPILLKHTAAHGNTTAPEAFSYNSLYTTVEDYAKFINAWLNDENETMQKAFSPAVPMTKYAWAKRAGVKQEDLQHVAWGLGIGLQTKKENGNTVATRAFSYGDMNQWRSWVAVDLEKKGSEKIVVYFSESEHGNGNVLTKTIISPHIELNNVFNYFFNKLRFAKSVDAPIQIRSATPRFSHDLLNTSNGVL